MPPRNDNDSPTAPPAANWDFPPWGRLAYVDGVRAIAIIAVIGFHAHIPGFRGGFVGVDVFFVISGFLITHQIVSQLLTGRFSASDFYARRILRILPPLLLVTVVTLALAPLFAVLPQESHDLAKSAAATAAMISNYYFSSAGDYFSPQAEINPLLHTWSLGVEEQYYLLAPAFMGGIAALAARRHWDARRALLIFGVAIAVSYLTTGLVAANRPPHRLLLDHDAVVAVRGGRHARHRRAQRHAGAGAAAVGAGRRGTAGGRRFGRALSRAHALSGSVGGRMPTLGTVLLLASGSATNGRRWCGSWRAVQRSPSACCPTAGISGIGR